MYKLAPSILAANFTNLGNDIKNVEAAGAHYLHIDVMDGHFVPNISIGTPVVKSIRKITDMTLDVHLMISEPSKYIKSFIDAGADLINFHLEVEEDILENINLIKSFNKRVAIAIKPSTNIEEVYPYLDNLDMVLIMSVEPGFGGQEFMKSTLKKAETLSNYVSQKGILLDIQMDGGIYLDNVKEIINSGVNVIVAGSAIFGAEDTSVAVKDFYTIFRSNS